MTFTTNYVIKAADINRNLSFATNFPAGFNFVCSSSGQSNTIHFEVAAAGNASTDVPSLASACQTRGVRVIFPNIACTKFCTDAIGESGAISFRGTVTNSGDVVLRGVSVSNLVNGVLTLVTNISFLNAGATADFSGSYFSTNPCSPTTDTIFVRGSDDFGKTVTSQCTATCSNVLTPTFTLTKACVTNPVPFNAPVFISGTFTNTGNVTLTNITIDNNQPANPTRLVGPITLAPGGFTNFTRSYTPANPCAPFPDTLTANASTICGVALAPQTAAITCNIE